MRTKPGHRKDRRALLAAGAVCAAAGVLRGQDCLWTARPTAAPSGLQYFKAVYQASAARTLLVGGPSPMQVLAWDQNGWSALASGGPSDRLGHAIAYDTARGRLVLFAGRTAPPFTFVKRDTWEWDGVAWLLRSETGPAGRYGHAMVYDAARGRCVMFGGIIIAGSPQIGTWEWDGDQWAMITTQGPTPRDQPSMVYDSDRARTVLFGGSYQADTWEWDGLAWVQRSAAGPPGRYGAQLLYDPGRRRGVLFGSPYATILDTWEYDGASGMWELRAGAVPSITPDRASVFDTVRGVGVAFESGTNLWEWRGSALEVRPWLSEQPTPYQEVLPGGAATISAAAQGSTPISYQWWHGASPLANGGNISGADTSTLHIDPVTIPDFGDYSLVVSNSCGASTSAIAWLRPVRQCYANCDGSWVSPFLNVIDFHCYLDMFAAGCANPANCYINCDGSTRPPTLNVLDFQCFLNAYAAGCTVP